MKPLLNENEICGTRGYDNSRSVFAFGRAGGCRSIRVALPSGTAIIISENEQREFRRKSASAGSFAGQSQRRPANSKADFLQSFLEPGTRNSEQAASNGNGPAVGKNRASEFTQCRAGREIEPLLAVRLERTPQIITNGSQSPSLTYLAGEGRVERPESQGDGLRHRLPAVAVIEKTEVKKKFEKI